MNRPRYTEETWPSSLLRYGLPGFLGSTLLLIGALGAGWLPLNTHLTDIALVNALRETTSGVLLCRALILAGAAVLLQSWLVLGHDLLSGRHTAHTRLFAILGMWCLPLVVAPPLFSRDVYSYYLQGRLVIAGYDPYTTAVSVIPGWFTDGVDPMWAETPTPYGPIFLVLARGIANFSGLNPFFAAILFRSVGLIGVALLAYSITVLAERHGISRSGALWLAVLNPLLIMHFVAGAHNDALMVGLLVSAFALASKNHMIWATIVLALSAGVKPISLLALPFLGLMWCINDPTWSQRIIGWLKTLGVAVISFGLITVVSGLGMGWVSALSAPSAVRTWLAPVSALGMGIGGIATWIGVTGSDATILSIFRLMGTVVALGLVAWLLLRPSGRPATRGAGFALLAVVLLGPTVQPWYLLWSLPLLAATGLTARQVRIAVIGTAAFVLYGMAESSATADSLLQVTDFVVMALAGALVITILLASPRERRLVLGDPLDSDLMPHTPEQRERASAMVIHGPELAR